jgi:hypothetical protein
MPRQRRANEASSYSPAPAIPAQIADRYEVIRAVLGGSMMVSEGARQLGMARNNFQALLHRAQAAMLEALLPRPSGRAPKPARETALQKQVETLLRDKTRLQQQLGSMDRLLAVASEVIQELRQARPRARSRRSSKRSTQSSTSGAEPEDAEATQLVARAMMMSEPSSLAARALGLKASTLRRWCARCARGRPARRRRGPARRYSLAAANEVRHLVRELHGLAGAAALARSVVGVSRRLAGELKAQELQALERQRRAGCARVEVLSPGVLRGFDAMHVSPVDAFALIAADGAVPFRTSITASPCYTGHSVARALRTDFEAHGAPLVCRYDRARCHSTPEVASVFADHGVIALQGPPRCAQYYGQLERQNREHRAWLDFLGPLTFEQLVRECSRMRNALNTLWHRPMIDWCTAAERWHARQPPNDDRIELKREVAQRASRFEDDDVAPDLAMRLAIEQALGERGHLRITPGHKTLGAM